MEGPISDDEFEIVEHPEEEPTAVEPPRPELPFCEEAVPCQIADEISETVSREIIKDTKKLGAPKVQLHGSVHVLLGVVMLMGVLRLVVESWMLSSHSTAKPFRVARPNFTATDPKTDDVPWRHEPVRRPQRPYLSAVAQRANQLEAELENARVAAIERGATAAAAITHAAQLSAALADKEAALQRATEELEAKAEEMDREHKWAVAAINYFATEASKTAQEHSTRGGLALVRRGQSLLRGDLSDTSGELHLAQEILHNTTTALVHAQHGAAGGGRAVAAPPPSPAPLTLLELPRPPPSPPPPARRAAPPPPTPGRDGTPAPADAWRLPAVPLLPFPTDLPMAGLARALFADSARSAAAAAARPPVISTALALQTAPPLVMPPLASAAAFKPEPAPRAVPPRPRRRHRDGAARAAAPRAASPRAASHALVIPASLDLASRRPSPPAKRAAAEPTPHAPRRAPALPLLGPQDGRAARVASVCPLCFTPGRPWPPPPTHLKPEIRIVSQLLRLSPDDSASFPPASALRGALASSAWLETAALAPPPAPLPRAAAAAVGAYTGLAVSVYSPLLWQPRGTAAGAVFPLVVGKVVVKGENGKTAVYEHYYNRSARFIPPADDVSTALVLSRLMAVLLARRKQFAPPSFNWTFAAPAAPVARTAALAAPALPARALAAPARHAPPAKTAKKNRTHGKMYAYGKAYGLASRAAGAPRAAPSTALALRRAAPSSTAAAVYAPATTLAAANESRALSVRVRLPALPDNLTAGVEHLALPMPAATPPSGSYARARAPASRAVALRRGALPPACTTRRAPSRAARRANGTALAPPAAATTASAALTKALALAPHSAPPPLPPSPPPVGKKPHLGGSGASYLGFAPPPLPSFSPPPPPRAPSPPSHPPPPPSAPPPSAPYFPGGPPAPPAAPPDHVPYFVAAYTPYNWASPPTNADYRPYFGTHDKYLAWCRMNACANAARAKWCAAGGAAACKNECAPNATSTCRQSDAATRVPPALVAAAAAPAAAAAAAHNHTHLDDLKRQRRAAQQKRAAPPANATGGTGLNGKVSNLSRARAAKAAWGHEDWR